MGERQNTGQKLEGLSLSLCIEDIITDKVRPDQVERIITGTRNLKPGISDNELTDILNEHAQVSWQQNPARAVSIARDFFNAGKIVQPTKGVPYPGLGHWREPGQTEQFKIA